MWISNINIEEGKYDYLNERFKIAYKFLKRSDLDTLPVGPIALDGEDVVAYIQHYDTLDAKELNFETHDKFFDIQFVISGKEMFEIISRDGLTPVSPYDKLKDICFYEEPEESGNILIGPGDYVVVGPEDAHKPRCMAYVPTAVKKVVIKVRV
ncbi:YhcH/YjgK/YiaL family protein [Clostridium estertheticum]|uniref:YhcH/YjgK/YiaL family protein n=1 Tax=Clostridium estertheticum TaxID=238834 RepID=UPI001CF56307|nr:YhcH/YjgK/YiaL family protein [Clostridium estertheticum]MCB2358593.1 YhcH/YjgK/YiaL family protein [Clostridium estertheticum]